MSSKIYTTALLSLLTIVANGCQDENDPYRGRRHGASSRGDLASVDFEAANSQTSENSLSLAEGDVAPVAAFKISVACDGVTPVEFDAAPFNLPAGATNCIAKLKSIKIGEKNYVEPAGGAGFTNYAVNEVGKFENEKDANDKLYVRVRKQLPSPLTADVAVQYDYSNIQSFETVQGTREGQDNVFTSGGANAPQIKATSAKLSGNTLNVKLTCTDTAGFVGAGMADLTCAGVKVKDMKIAIDGRATDDAPKAEDLKSLIQKSGKSISTLGSFVAAEKSLLLGFKDVKDSQYYLIAAANGDSYTYGFIKIGGGAIANVTKCPAQGNQANFVLEPASTIPGISEWRDTSNCNAWLRPTLLKVESSKRFALCRAATKGAPDGKLLLPYGADMKAAYDRNIKDLAFGDAPKLGDPNTTFWMAGGRVFDMATGKFREVKDIKPHEEHSVVCFFRKN